MLIYKGEDEDETPFGPGQGLPQEEDDTPLRPGKKSRKLKKLLIMLLITCVVAGTVILLYPKKTQTPALIESTVKEQPQSIVSQLDSLEKEENHMELIKILYSNVEPEFSKEVLPWLEAREDIGYTPYLYATARHMLITKQPYQALLYYNAAGLMSRIDAAHCTDRSTAGMVSFLEGGFKGVHEYMATNPDSRAAAGAWALMKEENLKNRPLPAWLCLSGENPSPYVPYVAEEIWQNERVQIRDAFAAFIEEPQSNTAPEQQSGAQ